MVSAMGWRKIPSEDVAPIPMQLMTMPPATITHP
jgi:hypothetical protein